MAGTATEEVRADAPVDQSNPMEGYVMPSVKLMQKVFYRRDDSASPIGGLVAKVGRWAINVNVLTENGWSMKVDVVHERDPRRALKMHVASEGYWTL